MTDRLGFLDLPSELRNDIYARCLTAPMMLHVANGLPGEKRWVSWMPDAPWIGRARQSANLVPNLLLASKTINSEATAVLYGSNYFRVFAWQRGEQPRDQWTVSIGSSIRYIRKLYLRDVNTRHSIRKQLIPLKEAVFLVSLEIECDCEDIYGSPEAMANGFYPMMLELHKSRIDADLPHVLGVVRVIPIYDDSDIRQAKRIIGKKLEQFDKDWDIQKMNDSGSVSVGTRESLISLTSLVSTLELVLYVREF